MLAFRLAYSLHAKSLHAESLLTVMANVTFGLSNLLPARNEKERVVMKHPRRLQLFYITPLTESLLEQPGVA